MGNPLYWIIGAWLFGIISAALYAWLSPRSKNRKGLFLRSTLVYTAVGLLIVWILFMISRE